MFKLSRDEILWAYIQSLLNTPYEWGGNTPCGMDCSGFAILVLKAGGWLPNSYDTTARGLHAKFAAKYPSKRPSVAAFMDLVFYGKSKPAISHVAISLGAGLVVEAGGGTSMTRSRSDAIRRNAFVRIRPLKYRRDLVDIIGLIV